MSAFRLSLLHLVLFLGTAVALPHLLLRPFSGESSTPFDSRPVKQLRRGHPEVVLIGNSMLQTRIDSPAFGQAYGKKSLSLPQGGSASAKWFLSLKNAVVASKAHPKKVIVFFRDYEISDPLFRTTGQYRSSVAQMKNGPEPELEAVQAGARDWRERFWAGLQNLSWAARVNRDVRDAYVYVAIRDRFPRASQNHLISLAKSRFEVEKLRTDLNFEPEALGRPLSGDLKAGIERSLLPSMFEVARTNGIQLILYRVERRPGTPSIDANYIAALREFCVERGVPFIEERELLGPLPADWYADGDHIRLTKRDEYSTLFGTKLRGRLQ